MKRSGSMKKYLGVLVAVFCLFAVSMFFATTTVTSVCAADETEITGAMNAAECLRLVPFAILCSLFAPLIEHYL